MNMNAGCVVVMPQMGESISKGTITRWLVEVGSRIERDQPLFEISTDKVDAEIPSPVSGILRGILHPAGATVPVDTVVAWIGPEDGDTEPPGGWESLQETARQNPSGGAQKAASNQTRILWIVLALYSGARLISRLHSAAQGEMEILKALLPGAALLFSVAQLLTAKQSLLYKLLVLVSVSMFLGAAVALLF